MAGGVAFGSAVWYYCRRMKAVTTTKEYARNAPRVETGRFLISSPKKKKEFADTAFGIFKKTLGEKSSLAYVNAMRKIWRK